MISSSSESCSQLVAGNYDVIVNDNPNFRTILSDYLEHFEHHELELMKNEQDFGYASEFKLLKEFSKTLKEDKSNLEDGELEFNLRKNRYKDIIPFNHTRVLLENDPSIPGSEYINANYIKGPSGSQKAYIACQGPLACTLTDFWRMVWECNVSIIVMACNEIESGKLKCELYWPEEVEGNKLYGNIQVTLVRVRQICNDFLIRKFSIKLLKPIQQEVILRTQNLAEQDETNNNNNCSSTTMHNNTGDIGKGDDEERKVLAERTICQFHYTTWPDHGAPDSVQPILELVRLMREVQPAEDKPILIHCSAGCGRTGTICCIDYVWGLLRRGKLDSSFDLCNIISEMRQQRMAMVQTLEQYILCHRAVAALFLNQLKLIDNHHYENLESSNEELTSLQEVNKNFSFDDDEDDLAENEERDFGPVFI